MTALPQGSDYIKNNARTEGEAKDWFDDLRDFVAQMAGAQAESELTIASGSVTPTRGVHNIDTESDAAADDLTNIVTTNLPDGSLLAIRQNNSGRVVTVKEAAGGAGQIHLMGAADVALNVVDGYLVLIRRGADWYEVVRGTHPGTARFNADKVQGKTVDLTGVATGDGLFYDGTKFVSKPAGVRGPAESELTIASGSVTPTRPLHSVDTESDAAADDLTNIVTTNLPDGSWLLVRQNNSGRVVTVKEAAGGAGQIHTLGAADFSLGSVDGYVLLVRRGADWYEVVRGTVPASGGSGGFTSVQSFNSSGTWNKPAGITKVIAEVWGSGGGGGGANGGTANDWSFGGGGGAGGYARTLIDVTGLSSMTITIGGGGAGGSSGTSWIGVQGGTTSIAGTNVSISVLGGGSGQRQLATSNVATCDHGSGGTVTISGSAVTTLIKQQGGVGGQGLALSEVVFGGAGGRPYGAIVRGHSILSIANSSSVAGQWSDDGDHPGCGGGGAVRRKHATNSAIGGDGADGRVTLYEFA